MRRLFSFISVALIAVFFVACSKDEHTATLPTSVQFLLKEGNGINELQITEATVSYKNISTGVEKSETVQVIDNRFTLPLMTGLYSFSFDAIGNCVQEGVLLNTLFRAFASSITVSGNETEVQLIPFIANTKADFVIEEIFYTGTIYPETSKSYVGDQYFRITNNSDEVLYADGLTIAESNFSTSAKYDYQPNIMAEFTAVQALYAIPGNGKEYPVLPGESIIIADKAINHFAEAHSNSLDLSNANFEWYDESSNSSNTDTDNPAVPNLDKIYCYTKTIWTLNKQGNKAYFLLRLGVDKETYLATYKYDYTYVITTTGTNSSGSCYKVPNNWIIDAVNLGTPDKWQWNVTDASLDGGHTHCGTSSSDAARYGKSVRRKTSEGGEKGHRVLQDTHNSTVDFERDVTPSMAL